MPGPGLFPRIVETTNDPVVTLVRGVLGGVLFAHAAQKVFGWFGGNGFQPVVEFLSSVGMIAGILCRVASVGIVVIMIGAIVVMIGPNGFFMNWFGQVEAGREGYEYHLLAMALAIVPLVRGAGAFSIDHLRTRSRSGGPGPERSVLAV